MAAHAVDPSSVDDGGLARAHVAGDPEAFAALYRRYFPDLVRFLERRGNDHARAEDVAQETLTRAFRYLGGFDDSRPMWPWLRTIAMRIASVEAQRGTTEVLVCDTPEGIDAAADLVDVVASRSALVASLRRLPDRQRNALVMRYVEDRQPSDIAAVLGLNKTAFEQLLWRARRSLAREYARVTSAVVVPLGLRLRRVAARADAQVAAAAPVAFAYAGEVAASVVLAVIAVTGTLPGTAGPATPAPAAAAPTTVLAASAMAPRDTARSATGVLAAVPQARPAAPGQSGPNDVTFEKEVGPASTTARTATDPNRDGRTEEDETAVDVPMVGRVRVYGWIDNSSGPGLACRTLGVCGPITP